MVHIRIGVMFICAHLLDRMYGMLSVGDVYMSGWMGGWMRGDDQTLGVVVFNVLFAY